MDDSGAGGGEVLLPPRPGRAARVTVTVTAGIAVLSIGVIVWLSFSGNLDDLAIPAYALVAASVTGGFLTGYLSASNLLSTEPERGEAGWLSAVSGRLLVVVVCIAPILLIPLCAGCYFWATALVSVALLIAVVAGAVGFVIGHVRHSLRQAQRQHDQRSATGEP